MSIPAKITRIKLEIMSQNIENHTKQSKQKKKKTIQTSLHNTKALKMLKCNNQP